MQSKFEKFEASYKEAVTQIKQFLEETKHEPSMRGLVKWMMETDANPYAYLPHAWAGSTGSAESFVSLLNHIHHAVYDDGDITFVTVNGEPRIVFVWRHQENFRDYVLSEQEKHMEKRFASEYEIKVLGIQPDEFGPLYDKHFTERLKDWFMNDAETHGVDFAVTHYRAYKQFDTSWISLIEAQK